MASAPAPLIVDRKDVRIVVFDSATHVESYYAGNPPGGRDIVVASSYAGVLCAKMIMNARPLAAIGLDCSIGKDGAGIAGLWYYEALGIPAGAADVMTAEMGNGPDLYENGVISRVNDCAQRYGVLPSMRVGEAIDALTGKPSTAWDPTRRLIVHRANDGRCVVCTDSIAFALPEDRDRNVLCTAGHTGSSVVEYFRAFRPSGFICSDGGIGKNNSGIVALKVVERDGIAGAAVDANTARMGDGQSTYFDGVISAANDLAKAKGVRVGDSARNAARLLLDAPPAKGT